MDDTLMLLAKEVRGKTLRLLDGVSEAESRWAPAGLANSIIWHAGHAVAVVEHLSVAPARGAEVQLPAGWFEMFGWKSRPTAQTQYPPLGEVVVKLREQLERLTAAIEPLTGEQLEKVVKADKGWTLRYSILHGLHDEAGHQGEIWLLKKMMKGQGVR